MCLPKAEEVHEMKSSVCLKYPSYHDEIGAEDGLKLLIESLCNWAKQERYFNGWKSDH